MVVISIQSRMGSTRLPGKALLTLGDKRVIHHVVSRCNAVDSVDDVVVTTGDRDPNDAIREWCHRFNVRCMTGPEENLLERHRQVLASTDHNELVRITGDCPFVPPAEIERVLSVHRRTETRYTTNLTPGMPIGTAVDVLNETILAELTYLEDTHPVERLRDEPEKCGIVKTTNENWHEFSSVHLAVDTPADYWSLCDAVSAVGDDPEEVARYLDTRSAER